MIISFIYIYTRKKINFETNCKKKKIETNQKNSPSHFLFYPGVITIEKKKKK